MQCTGGERLYKEKESLATDPKSIDQADATQARSRPTTPPNGGRGPARATGPRGASRKRPGSNEPPCGRETPLRPQLASPLLRTGGMVIRQPIPLPADRVPLQIPAKQEGVAEALIKRNLNVRRVQPTLGTAISDRREIVARNPSGTGSYRAFRR